MNERLFDLINSFQQDSRLSFFDEAAVKQAVVLKILDCLGWNFYNIDEVYPEYPIEAGKVDYALRCGDKNKVFIEVKKPGEDLEKHQDQLLKYSFKEGVKLAILTNGISWWFYLPLTEGSWEQRKFYNIDLCEQDAKDIAEKFEMFLAKQNIISSKAVENAENIYKNRRKQELIEESIPKAWEKIIKEQDEILVELLSVTTEKICGYKPDSEAIAQFLKTITTPTLVKPSKTKVAAPPIISEKEEYTGKSIISFTFRSEKYPVKSWVGMLIKICEIMFLSHRNQFGMVLNLVGKKRPYFSKNSNELRHPEKISNTDIYVETNLSANAIVKLSKKILTLFGYQENDLTLEVK